MLRSDLPTSQLISLEKPLKTHPKFHLISTLMFLSPVTLTMEISYQSDNGHPEMTVFGERRQMEEGGLRAGGVWIC